MKFTFQEEYGLRCLIRLARAGPGGCLSITKISSEEGLSIPHVAKLMRLLRLGNLVKSVRGLDGGYRLARPASEITVGEVMDLLGGQLYYADFCKEHAGLHGSCSHSADCSIRPVLSTAQRFLDRFFLSLTLNQMLCSEAEMEAHLTSTLDGVPRHQPSQRGNIRT